MSIKRSKLSSFVPSLLPFSIGAQVESEHVLSRLWIGRATAADSGNYSCSIPGHGATEFPRARVRVHVVDGENDDTAGAPQMNLCQVSLTSHAHAGPPNFSPNFLQTLLLPRTILIAVGGKCNL